MRTSILALLALTASAEVMTAEDYQFMNFIVTHGKSYGTKEEFEYRSNIFKAELAKIAETQENLTTSTVGVNFFADMTDAEKALRFGFVANPDQELNFGSFEGIEAASSVDWREQGAVTPIKDQG